MPETGRRLFFALWPDDGVAGQLDAAARKAHPACGGKPTRPDSLHVTLAFLGAVADSRVAAAEAAADAVAGEAFVLELDKLGFWKHNRILWAGCTSVPPTLENLARDLATELRAAGFALETRPFAVHATLLRKAHCPAAPMLIDAIRWPVGDFSLVESATLPDGARYRILQRWPLKRSP